MKKIGGKKMAEGKTDKKRTVREVLPEKTAEMIVGEAKAIVRHVVAYASRDPKIQRLAGKEVIITGVVKKVGGAFLLSIMPANEKSMAHLYVDATIMSSYIEKPNESAIKLMK